MMKKHYQVFIFFICLVAFFVAQAATVKGQSATITLENADGSRSIAFSQSTELLNQISLVPDRINIEWANGKRSISLPTIPSNLIENFGQVGKRVIVEWANTSRFKTLSFPAGISGDLQGPNISNLKSILQVPTVVISFDLDELGIASITYGPAASSERKTISQPLFFTHHEIIISDIPSQVMYTYQIKVTDRNGNQNQTPGANIIICYLTLPIVIK